MNLETIVRLYIQRIRPRAEAELAWFVRQPTLRETIRCAALAVNSCGKRYSHQRRIKREAIAQAHSILSGAKPRIKKCADFASLFRLIEAALEDVPGIGELYIYDTSLRIGAKLGILPEKVYLHAGTRTGARNLGLDVAKSTVRMASLPSPFRVLKPHEVEDVLCIFKDELKTSAASFRPSMVRRSWCG
jgi:hypothetical protein